MKLFATSILWLLMLSLFPTFLFAQPALNYKLQLLEPGKWGVYIKPDPIIHPSLLTNVGSAQVTVVMPLNFAWNNLTSVHGSWHSDASVHGPIENPTRSYLSFSMNPEFPHIDLISGQETLLFTFKMTGQVCPDSMYLINNLTDPFLPPNSVGNNPGNEMTVFDPMASGVYEYKANYAPSAWSCHDNDSDGLLNAFEDTNGNGIYDTGDPSSLNIYGSGIYYKLQLIESNKWGVYAKPLGITPSLMTITGSAQATVVMPLNFAWNNLTSVHGNWTSNSVVHGPIENPTKSYVSFALSSEYPHIDLIAGQETLLFTFKKIGQTCPDSMYLINNLTDPFIIPNSINSNPVNEMTVFDPEGLHVYGYAANYAHSAWSCHDNDSDGTLNAFEDTNGNGGYDGGVDVSDLNQGCSPIAFSVDPKDATVCSGNDTTFFATASIPQGTFTYGWQYSDDNGATWVDINFASMSALFSHTATGTVSSGTDVLTVKNVSLMYGRRFRAIANPTDCNAVYSNYAILSVQGPLSVTDQPDDVVECSGNPTLFSATIANPGVVGSTLVNWQVSINNGVTWVNLSNNTLYNGTATINASGLSTLSISNVAGLHNALFRLAYRTSTCTVQYSNAARLTVEGPITVTAHPVDKLLCSGTSTTFTSLANVGTSGTLAYQWQVSSDNGTNWSNIGAGSDGGVYANFNSTTLTVSEITGLYGRNYRLAFSTGECNQVYSNKAKLIVEGPIAIIDQPDDIFQCSGEAVNFIVGITNASPQDTTTLYQWQESINGGASWHNVTDDTLYNGSMTNQLSVSFTTGLNGYQYRCIISTLTCGQIISDAATLHLDGVLTVVDEPDNITACSGSGASFHANVTNAGSGSLIYQWEYSSNNGITWADITNSANITGATTTTLVLNNVAGMYGYRWRMRYRTTDCNALWTNYAVLTVEGPINLLTQPQSKTVCSGNGTYFSVTTANTGQGAITYQWQISPTGSAGPWSNLSNSSVYNGATSANLSIANVAGYNGYCYRVNIQTSFCGIISSDAGCLTVEGPINISQQPIDATACNGESAVFHSEAVISNSGNLQYQWQLSMDGINYSNINDSGVNDFAGWNTTTLTVGNTTDLNNVRFRLWASTNLCNYVFSTAARIISTGCSPACVKLKLQLLPDSSGWAVMARPFGTYVPSANAAATGGRITVVAPADFVLDGFTSVAGNWSPTNVQTNIPGHPGRKYITFELLDQQAIPLPLDYNLATSLFQFEKTGGCPDSLYILENFNGTAPNFLSGQDPAYTEGFELCGVYARKNWRCKPNTPSGPIIIVAEEDFGGAPQTETVKFGSHFPEGKSFTAYPNPAGEYVNIILSENMAEGQNTLALWDMQGRRLQEVLMENDDVQLDLSALPAGVYFISLAQNGHILERKELIKN